jgi:uncharacterized protein (DUF2147 family)
MKTKFKKMKAITFSLSLGLSLFFQSGFAQSKQTSANEVCGLYWSPKKDAKIQIYRKGAQYFGKSTWVAKAGRDVENPDEALRSRELLGIELLTHFSYAENTYTDGEVYDPANGKTYRCKMNLEGNLLYVRGFIGISLFGRTEVFERISKDGQ